MSYDVYWVKNRAEKIADFEHPTQKGQKRPAHFSIVERLGGFSCYKDTNNH